MKLANPRRCHGAAASAYPHRDHDPHTILLNLEVDLCSTCNHDAATAVCDTSGAGSVHVTLCAARPPRVSRLLVCCSGAVSASEPYIVAAELNIILLAVGVASKPLRYGYFVYRLEAGEENRPSLELISASISLDDSHVGLLPCKDGGYFVAALCYTSLPDKYDLHLYNSKTKQWTLDLGLVNKHQEQMKYYHANHKVVTSGGETGIMAWCDLSHGGMLCYDLLCPGTHLHYITLPPPILPGKKLKGCPRSCRDIAIFNGRIHYVELQIHASSTGGWTLAKWSTSATDPWDNVCWQQPDFSFNASQVSVPPHILELLPKPTDDEEGAAHRILMALHTGHPTLSLHNDHIVYLMAKVNHLDEKACVLAIDMNKLELKGVADFTADRVPGFCFTYTHTRVSRYPDIDGDLNNGEGRQDLRPRSHLKREGLVSTSRPVIERETSPPVIERSCKHRAGGQQSIGTDNANALRGLNFINFWA